LFGVECFVVFCVEFDCGCGDVHLGFVCYDEFDWVLFGFDDLILFLNLMMLCVEMVGVEFGDVVVVHIKVGEWLWMFFCWFEEWLCLVFLLVFWLFVLVVLGDWVGFVVRCLVCGKVLVNLVSCVYVDVLFVNDCEVGVVEYLFVDDVVVIVDEFHVELWLGFFDVWCLVLE